MNQRFLRQSLIIGEEATKALATKKVALFGVGGVGSYAAEALARCGIGTVELIDSDTVSESNINRQLCALESTVGQDKVEVVASRMRDINPDIKVITRKEFVLPENADLFDFSSYDCVVDCIDTVSGKIEIVMRATEAGVPVISSMGAANKLSAQAFEISDIYKTTVCPLARVMRTELRKRGVKKLKVVYSREEARTPLVAECDERGRRVPASISYVPAAAGLVVAQAVIGELLK